MHHHRLAIGLSLAIVLTATRAPLAATVCVNPGGTGGCYASIQAAVANSAARDVVAVAAGTYAEQVVIGPPKQLRLEGAGAGSTVIHPPTGPALRVSGTTRAEIAGLTLTGGAVLDDRASAEFADCVVDDGLVDAGARTTLGLTDCLLTAAAVHSIGSRLKVVRTEVRGSTGPGIAGSAKLDMIDSTVKDHYSYGLQLTGGGRIRGSTVSGNGVYGVHCGGDLFGGGTVRIERSTIHGNGFGGVNVTERYAAIIEHSTISDNGEFGLGVSPAFYRAPGRLTLHSSVVAGHAHDCAGAIRTTGSNVVQDLTGCTVRGPAPVTGDPLLAPLADNGGPTETQALVAGSPALGIVTDSSCRKPDQRGVARTAPCDAGSYEAP